MFTIHTAYDDSAKTFESFAVSETENVWLANGDTPQEARKNGEAVAREMGLLV